MENSGLIATAQRSLFKGCCRKFGFFFGAALILLVLAPLTRSSQSVQLNPPRAAIPETFFGLHIHHLFTGSSQLTPWPAVPFGSWRLWDAYVTWSNLEPRKDSWKFAMLDKYVALREQHDVRILLTLAWSPRWASVRPGDNGAGPPGAVAEPERISEWQNYVRTVATRYKGKIHEYEIWNEPNGKQFYTGTIPTMVELARVAYETLKEVDPSNIVTSPPATAVSGLPWLDAYLKAGGGQYADVIGYHLYVNPGPPEQMVPLIEQVQEIMKKHGVGYKPLWDTETGWAIQNKQELVEPAPGHGFNSIVLPEGVAAAYMARAYILSWASGVSRLYWYAWDNRIMGLVDRDGKTLKATAIAYGELQKWLIGAKMTSCQENSVQTWTCAIARPGGYRGWIIWNPTATRQLIKFSVPVAWHVTRVRDLLGHTSSLHPGSTFEISVMPHLLETATQ
jgi:hypothetical protein